MFKRKLRSAFTLVELLAVIAIVGLLIALILPAVQSAREASRRTYCSNSAKQLALGCLQHQAAQGHFPTGGWGFDWVGDPDKGFGWQQPGGWIFNILPYIDQQGLRDLQLGKAGAERERAGSQMISTPLPVLNCPTRRASIPYYADTSRGTFRSPLIGGPTRSQRTSSTPAVARTCYAASGGATRVVVSSTVAALRGGFGPVSYPANPDAFYRDDLLVFVRQVTGVVGIGTQVTPAHVLDGLGNTYLLGEKFLNPDHYTTGLDGGDNENMYTGINNDHVRYSLNGPLQDRPSFAIDWIWGSAHSSGFTMVLCDGSVRHVAYTINPVVHTNLSLRADGTIVDMSGL